MKKRKHISVQGKEGTVSKKKKEEDNLATFDPKYQYNRQMLRSAKDTHFLAKCLAEAFEEIKILYFVAIKYL